MYTTQTQPLLGNNAEAQALSKISTAKEASNKGYTVIEKNQEAISGHQNYSHCL